MRKKLLATLRGLSAVVLMLFATNFLPVAAAFADKPVDPGNGQNLAASTATSPLNYTGQGIPVDQQCDANNTPYLLFIFTYGGNYNPTNVTLHGITVQSQSQMGNETHFTTNYVDPTTLTNTVNVTWSGDVGANAQLVISHGCAGTVTPPTDVCANIEGVQTTVPEGKVLVDGNCVTPPTDVCKNIEGNQATVPEGMTVNDNGICKEVKVFVCKYVGTPGVDERLQTGQNPISVSVNSLKNFNGIGSFFNDAQGRSFALAFDVGQAEPDVSQCEAPAPTQVTPAVSFNEPTCENTNGRVTVTAMNGVTYKVNGNVITGTTSFAAGSSVTVTTELATGFVLASGAQGSFSHTFAAAPTDCVLGAVTGGRGGDVLGATTAQLANTGQSPWAAIIVGVTVISLTLTSAFASRRVRLNA